MARSNLKVASQAPPARTPERQALADAIARRAEAERRLADVKAAAARAAAAFYDADAAVDAAKAALAEAKADEPAQLVAEFTGNADPAVPSLHDAIAAVERAEAEVERLGRAREALADAQREVERELEWAAHSVRDRVRDLLRAEAVAPLRAKLDRAHRVFAELRAAAEVVLHASFKPGDPQCWWYEIDPHTLTGDRPWREAIALLERDADAPLPSD